MDALRLFGFYLSIRIKRRKNPWIKEVVKIRKFVKFANP
jgi:hypothetical protein